MISSDNVIRFGLTHKFCDLKALKLIPHETCNRISEVKKEERVIHSGGVEVARWARYINPTKYLSAFVVTVYHICKGNTFDVSIKSPALVVIYKGRASMEGSSYAIGAAFLVRDRQSLSVSAEEDVSMVTLW